MKYQPKWIVFDLGGIVLDWHGGLKATAKFLKVSCDELLHIFLKYLPEMEVGKIEPIAAWNRILSDLELSSMYKGEEILKIWLNGCTWIETSWELITDLYKREYLLAACTNNWKGITESYLLPKRNEFCFFQQIIDSSEIGYRKPDNKIFQIVEFKLKAKGKEILFIEDSAENLQEAKSFGWETFFFELGFDRGLSSCNKIRDLLFE